MNSASREDIQQIVDSIQQGRVVRKDLRVLLIELRSSLRSGALKDIANFVAHPEGRDKGQGQQHLEAFVENFVSVAESSGKLVVSPAYSRAQILAELTTHLTVQGFKVDASLLAAMEMGIFKAIEEIMDGALVILKNKYVTAAGITVLGGRLVFIVQFKGLASGPVIKVPEGAELAFDVFGP